MFGFLKKIFRVKTRELEANLYPSPTCTYGGKGEVEISWYSDSSIELELSLKHSGVPDGSEVDFYCGRDKVGTVTVRGGYVKSKEIYHDMDVDIPAGTSAEIRLQGSVIYQGQLQPD